MDNGTPTTRRLDKQRNKVQQCPLLGKWHQAQSRAVFRNLGQTVATDPAARLIGYVSAASDEDPVEAVPQEFRQYLRIMGKEAADALPKHRPYDCKIDLEEGSTVPWEPSYPLSEIELQTLREWLKDMEQTGKIKRSTSLAGSPILFVPKPHRRGLHLCVDYWALNCNGTGSGGLPVAGRTRAAASRRRAVGRGQGRRRADGAQR